MNARSVCLTMCSKICLRYADINRDELIKLIVYLRERLEESDTARRREREESASMISDLTAQVSALTEKISELTDMLRKSREDTSALTLQLSVLLRQLGEKDRLIADLQSTVKVGRKIRFGEKSQKGIKPKPKGDDRHSTPHTDVKDDFDGTPESLPENLDVDAGVNEDARFSSAGPAVAQKGNTGRKTETIR